MWTKSKKLRVSGEEDQRFVYQKILHGAFVLPNAHWQKSQYLSQNNPKKDVNDNGHHGSTVESRVCLHLT